MQFKSFGNIDFTDEQLRGLAIANAQLNQRRVDTGQPMLSDEDDLVRRVLDVVDTLAEQHIFSVQRERINQAFTSASTAERSAAVSALNADVTVDIPAVVIVQLNEEPVVNIRP